LFLFIFPVIAADLYTCSLSAISISHLHTTNIDIYSNKKNKTALTKLKQGGRKVETKLKQTNKSKAFEVNLTNGYPNLSKRKNDT
jgi:hypothetical protein